MGKQLRIMLVVAALSLPAFAQWQQRRLSAGDQTRFDSYYSRWQDYRRANDREQTISMEKRMLDVYAHYNISANTPYWRVASNGRSPRDQWRGLLSARDQSRFDSYFSRWQDYRRGNDREQIVSMETRMQDVYAHYNVPADTPFFWLASNTRDEDWDRWERERWRGRLSAEDQGRFDSYYTRWLEYIRDHRRDQVESMEGRMRDVMQSYQIPPQVPYEQVASRGAGR